MTWKWREALANAEDYDRARHTAERTALAEQQARRAAEQLLTASTIDRAVALGDSGDVHQCMLWLARALEMADRCGATDLERVCRDNLAQWRFALLRRRAVLSHPGRVTAAVFHPAGTLLAIGGFDGSVRFWDPLTGQAACNVLSGEPLPPLKHVWPIRQIVFSPDGRFLLTGTAADDGKQGEIHIWDTATGKASAGSPSVAGGVQVLALSHDGSRLLVVAGGQAFLHQAEAGKPLDCQPRLRLAHPGAVTAAALCLDGQAVVTAGADGCARLWAGDGRPLGEPLRHPGRLLHVAFSPDGRLLATGYRPTGEEQAGLPRDEARLWDGATGHPIGAAIVHTGPLNVVTFSPDSQLLLSAGTASGTGLNNGPRGEIRLTTTVDGQPLLGPISQWGPVHSVAFSPDGRTFLAGNRDLRARLLCTATGMLIDEKVIVPGAIDTLAWSPDGRLALVGSSAGMRTDLWEMPPGQAAALPLRMGYVIEQMIVSPDRRTVLASAAQVTQLWDLEASRPIGVPMKHPPTFGFASFRVCPISHGW